MPPSSARRHRVAIVLGTRPEAIKLAPVIHALGRRPDVFEPVVITTSQQREMLAQAMHAFKLTADIDLGLTHANQTLAGCTTELVAGLVRVSAVLDSLGRLPTPPRAPAADRPVAVKFTAWLRHAAARMGALAAKARKTARAPLPGSGKSLTPFGQQTLALQQQLLQESTQFTLTSPELKTRHDMALNAIRNLK